jgi:hypothetical protein
MKGAAGISMYTGSLPSIFEGYWRLWKISKKKVLRCPEIALE